MIAKRLIDQGRKLLASDWANAWSWGDLALEVEPIGRDVKGPNRTKKGNLLEFAELLEVNFGTLGVQRSIANSWPTERRRVDVSWSIHQRLAGHPDRFELIKSQDEWKQSEAHQIMLDYRESLGVFSKSINDLPNTSLHIHLSFEQHASLQALARVQQEPMEQLVRSWIGIMLNMEDRIAG